MDNYTTETFCYETRCEHNFMKKYCVSYNDKKLHPVSKDLPGHLECKNFRLKTKKKKRINIHSVSFATPQAITKDAIKLLTEKEHK